MIGSREEQPRPLRGFKASALVRQIQGVGNEVHDEIRVRIPQDQVSSDIIRDSRASVIDLGLTQVIDGDLVKVMSWYDNEWGYSSQMVREARRIASDIDGRRT